jgi:HK97 family phage major capsid protein
MSGTMLKDKIEERARVWEEMKPLLDEDTAEAREKYDRCEEQLEALSAEIDRLERHANRATKLDAIDRSTQQRLHDTGEEDERAGSNERGDRYAEAFGAWVRSLDGVAGMEPEQRQILRNGGLDTQELRALGVGTNTAGGFTVPQGFRDELIRQMAAFGGMLDVAQVIRTDSGGKLVWPTMDDTATEGRILAENTVAPQTDVAFGQADLDAYMYTSDAVLVSFQLLNDAAIDVEGVVRSALAERVGRIWNRHFTTGTGTSQPDGIVTGAPIAKTGAAGQTTTVTFDDLLDVIHAVDPAYRATGVGWMMSDAAMKAVRRLKDADGRPLWEPSLQAGVAETLLGYPITINQHVPAPAASAKSILFGNFRAAYVIRIVNDFGLLRLNERYADALQVGFLGYARADGTLQNASAVRAYQHSAT